MTKENLYSASTWSSTESVKKMLLTRKTHRCLFSSEKRKRHYDPNLEKTSHSISTINKNIPLAFFENFQSLITFNEVSESFWQITNRS